MKVSTIVHVLPSLLIASDAAFTAPLQRPIFRPSTVLKYVEKQHHESLNVEASSSKDPVWIKETFMDRVVTCVQTEDTCEITELESLVEEMSRLEDKECFFAEAHENDCEKEATSRNVVKRILELKKELTQLENQLEDNHFMNSVTQDREERHSNHWFKDYTDFHHH